MQRLIALLEALLNLLDLSSLIVAQIKLAPERAKRSETLARTSRSTRTSRPAASWSKSIRRRTTLKPSRRKTTLARRSWSTRRRTCHWPNARPTGPRGCCDQTTTAATNKTAAATAERPIFLQYLFTFILLSLNYCD